MGRGFDTIVSTADNLPLQIDRLRVLRQVRRDVPHRLHRDQPAPLASYDLDESRCIFCGECVEVCPYDALEQTDFFELAGYSRTQLAGESLFVRDRQARRPAARDACPTSCPHVRDARRGDGWQWDADQGRSASRLDERSERLMPHGDFHPVLFVIVAVWMLVCGLGVVAFSKIVYSAMSMVFCFLGVAFAYVLLHAGLLAVIQILVYVGAISVVISSPSC